MVSAEELERLAVAQVVFKGIAEQMATGDKAKDPNAVRAHADAGFVDAYLEVGVKSLDLKVGGVKVGTYSLTFADDVEVDDQAAVDEWLVASGKARVVESVDLDALGPDARGRLLAFARVLSPTCVVSKVERQKDWYKSLETDADGTTVDSATGEVVDGVKVCKVPKSTSLKVDDKKVRQMLPALRPTVMALIGFGEDGND